MNEHGHGINYHSDMVRWSTRRHAITSGWMETDGTDDFNVATLRNGRLSAFGWMEKDFAPEDTELDEIGRQLAIEVSRG
jgi:hypothetical protein